MDIKSPSLLYIKGGLFLTGGVLAGGLLLLDSPTLRAAVLLAVCIWCLARAYYFAFYVIEHYIDPSYRFAGLLSLLKYWIFRRHSSKEPRTK